MSSRTDKPKKGTSKNSCSNDNNRESSKENGLETVKNYSGPPPVGVGNFRTQHSVMKFYKENKEQRAKEDNAASKPDQSAKSRKGALETDRNFGKQLRPGLGRGAALRESPRKKENLHNGNGVKINGVYFAKPLMKFPEDVDPNSYDCILEAPVAHQLRTVLERPADQFSRGSNRNLYKNKKESNDSETKESNSTDGSECSDFYMQQTRKHRTKQEEIDEKTKDYFPPLNSKPQPKIKSQELSFSKSYSDALSANGYKMDYSFPALNSSTLSSTSGLESPIDDPDVMLEDSSEENF